MLPAPAARYEFRRLLGRGGAGAVYEAWDRQLQRLVAIKQLEAARGDALAEARLAASLSHPAFVAVHEVFEHDGRACIVMDLVRGLTLADIVAEGPVERASARAWITEAAQALAQAHARKIVHGDIKPANLMVDGDGRLRILDFGIARLVDPLRTAADGAPASGTLRYMAPELLLGMPGGPRADVYALGLVLLELLQGERAFAGYAELALAHHKLASSDSAVPPENAERDPLWALADRMTRRSPQQRPTAADVQAALQRLGGAPRGAHRPWRRLAWTLAPALVAAAAGLAWKFESRRSVAPQQAVADDMADMAEAQRLLRDFDTDGALARSVALLGGVLARRPDNAAAAASIAIAYCLLDGSDASDPSWLVRADASSQLALRIDDQLALAHAARGRYLKEAGRTDEAGREFERALLLSPLEFHALLGQAELLTAQRRDKQARRVLDVALAAYPREGVLQDALGTLLYQQADYRGAEQAFRAATALRPRSPVGYANLAVVLLHEKRPDEALAVLQQGLAVQPDGRLYDNLGTVLFSRGRYAEAAEAFERAVSASRGNPNDYLKWANLADALRWLPGRETEARAAYEHALQMLAPRLGNGAVDATLASRAGLYAAKLGDARRALDWTRQALATAPDSAAVAFRAAVAAELSGNRKLALQCAGQALARGYPLHLVQEEPDLVALRRTHEFHRLLTEKLP